MPVYVAPADPMWDFMRQPCISVGCKLDVTISEDRAHFGWIVQHGPNEEHRTFVSKTELINPVNWGVCLARRWLEKVHAPGPFPTVYETGWDEGYQELADAIR